MWDSFPGCRGVSSLPAARRVARGEQAEPSRLGWHRSGHTRPSLLQSANEIVYQQYFFWALLIFETRYLFASSQYCRSLHSLLSLRENKFKKLFVQEKEEKIRPFS